MKAFLTLLIAMLLTTSVFAQDTTKILVPRNILTKEQIASTTERTTVERIGQYVGLGKEIGTAVKEGLNATVDVAERAADTKPGRFTMWMIAYKVVGHDAIRIVVGAFIWIVALSVIVTSYFRTAVARRVKVGDKWWTAEDKKTPKQHELEWEVINNDYTADLRKWGHVGVAMLFTIACGMIMFLNSRP
jgi:hypothetical protein